MLASVYPDEFPYSDFDEGFTRMVHGFPSKLFERLRNRMIESKSLFSKSGICLELVVDTNILFSEVRSLVVNKKSFFMTISQNPFVKLYAPSTLKEELFAKIKIKFPKDKKTRDIPMEVCIEEANKLLEKIIIEDRICDKAKAKADSHLQGRDPKDVPFLALGFTLGTHGIMTHDKDYNEQDEVATYNLKDTGKVVSELSKGSVSVFILESTVPLIYEALKNIITAIWGAIISVVTTLTNWMLRLLQGGIEFLIDLPTPLLIAIGIGLIYLMVNERARNSTSEFFEEVWRTIKPIVTKLRNMFLDIWKLLKEFWEAIEPLVMATAGTLLYLTENSMVALDRINELEKTRPTS